LNKRANDASPRKHRFAIASLIVVGCIAVATAWVYGLLPQWPQSPIGPIKRADDSVGQWPVSTGSSGGLKYSALTQVNRDNVRALEVAWTYHTGALQGLDVKAAHAAYSLQATPILIEGNLILCSNTMQVFALDPTSGEPRWKFDPRMKQSTRGATFSKCRGVAAWTDSAAAADAPCKTRIIFAAGLDIYAIDARHGQRCAGFGQDGVVTVTVPGMVLPDEVQLRSPAAVIGDKVIFGSTIVDAYRINSPSGEVRAFNVRTGELLWEYDPIPRDRSNPASETWGKNSATYYGATNVWSFISVDPVHNLVFLPTSAPSADYYGGGRPGDNRWADSVVALDATTGKQVWAFQTTHHDIWDFDLPAEPLLTDIDVSGQRIPAVVQLTKQGFIFVLNRLTGDPIFPVVERPVPQNSDVPGEMLSPTQPFPTVMPTLTPTSLRPDEAWGVTPFDRQACRDLISKYRSEGLYTPPTLQGTVFLPSIAGGANWGGGAVDPGEAVMVVPTMNLPLVVTLFKRGAPAPRGSGIRIENGAYPLYGTPYEMDPQFLVSPLGAPCSAPPWGSLTAVELNSGKVRWTVPLGTIEKLARFAPPLHLGTPFVGGPLVTAGRIAFMGGTTDDKLRAFDMQTGKTLWTGTLPAPGMSSPMTYSVNAKQFVVIAAGGSNLFPTEIGDSIVAFALKQ
jgi:quinoprotein glucose dehydrogenase